MPVNTDTWKYPPIDLFDDNKSNLGQILSSELMNKSTSKLEVAMGFDVMGNPVVDDIKTMFNLFVTGKETCGKTSLIRSFLASLLFKNSPSDLKLVIMDSSRVELTGFNGIPHLLAPVIVEPEKGVSALRWTLAELDRRHKLISEAGVTNIDGYNEMSGFTALPNIVIVIDDYSEMSMFSPVEYNDPLARIYQFGKRVGIYTITATTKPVKIIANPVQTQINFSLDEKSLLAPHDYLLIKNRDNYPICLQSPTINALVINKMVSFIKEQGVTADYSEEVSMMPKFGTVIISGVAGDIDDLFTEAVKIVCQYDLASSSLLQRRLSIGYARASRIMDQLEACGVVSASDGSSKPREVLVQNAEEFLSKQKNGI